VLCAPEDEVEVAPEHLSDAEAAALPLTGLTAWRAFVVKSGNAVAGRNILVTGIGGGVALNVLQFAVAMGCRVYVTSGSEEKIGRAKEMGAVGGVSYKKADWEKELMKLLPKDRPWLDAVVDGAGGDICAKTLKILKVGLFLTIEHARDVIFIVMLKLTSLLVGWNCRDLWYDAWP